MTTKSPGILNSVKEGISKAIEGTGDVAQTTMDAVSSTIRTALKDTGEIGLGVKDLVVDSATGVAQGIKNISGEIGNAARGTVRGIIHGTSDNVTKEKDRLQTIQDASDAFVCETCKRNGNVEAAAKGVIQGAIEEAEACGISRDAAASAACSGALRGAQKHSNETYQRALNATVGNVIGGVKVQREAGSFVR